MRVPVQPGQIVNGKYRIERMLGKGGMGVVVAAHHLALDHTVAIKLLLPALVEDPMVVERFAREARAASKIESDHVARVSDVGQLDDGTPFMVMEYLEGRDLSVVRAQGQALPVPTAVRYVIEAAEAIGEAHRRGIVHRDVKPANLFLAERSDGGARIKVLDFGLSKLDAGDRVQPGVTNIATVMGSPEYMSPEQMLSSHDVDAGTDIWALGVTLYELLTARVPFAGETVTQIYANAMTKPPPPPSAFRPDVPPGLDQAILRCLERDRARRYAAVEHFRDALLPYAAPDGVQLPSTWASEARLSAASVGTMGGTKTPVWPLAVGAGVIVAAALGAIVIVSSYGSARAPRAAASAAPAITGSAQPKAAPAAPTVASPPPAVTAAPSAAPVAGNAKDSPSAPAAAARPTPAPMSAAGTKLTAAPKPNAKPPKAEPSDAHSMD